MQTKAQPVEHDHTFNIFCVLVISSGFTTNKKSPMLFDHKFNPFFAVLIQQRFQHQLPTFLPKRYTTRLQTMTFT